MHTDTQQFQERRHVPTADCCGYMPGLKNIKTFNLDAFILTYVIKCAIAFTCIENIGWM